MTVEREAPPPGWVPQPESRWARIPGAIKGLGVLVVLALIIAAIVAATGGGKDKPTDPRHAAGEKAGVVFSSIATNSGGSDKLHGFPIGFPHSRTGAIEAAFSYLQATTSSTMMADATGPDLVTYMTRGLTWNSWLQDAVTPNRQRWKLNAAGQVLGANGVVDPTKTFKSQLFLRYGVFRVVAASADAVTVEAWAPEVLGVFDANSSKQPNLTYDASSGVVRLIWVDGDWRLDWATEKDGDGTALPSSGPAASFAYRGKHFPEGAGWKVPADATQSLHLPDGTIQGQR